MTRRLFLQALAAAPPPPNVILILADDMGYADLGCFGAKDIRTPHLDSLARQGVKLTSHYSNGPVCSPTRCALMTGSYQQRYGIEWATTPADKNVGLPPSKITLPRLLKQAGYRTALYGKWHLGREPQFNPVHHGFDEFFGFLGGNVDMYTKQIRSGEPDLYEGLNPVQTPGYLTELLAARAESFLAANDPKPFFLYLPFNAVHWPFQAPNRPQDTRNQKTWTDGTRADDYKPMLEAMDAAIGRLLAALDRSGRARNTLVIFSNDNGGERLSSNQPFRHHKGTLWEGGIRVPGIVRWPARIPRGKVSSQVCASMDLATTILAAANLPAPSGSDGVNLLPVLTGEKPPFPRTLCWRIDRPDRRARAIRIGKWKYVADANINHLFDLEADPTETRDLFYEQPEQARQLIAELRRWEEAVKTPGP